MNISSARKLSLILAGCLCFAASAQAQNPEEGDTEADLGGGVETSAAVNSDTLASASTDIGTNSALEIAGDSDHSNVIGKFGVGFFGTVSIPLIQGDCVAGNSCAGPDRLVAPTIGVRYWVSDSLGIEAAIGFAIRSDSNEADNSGNPALNVSNDVTGVGFALHGGAPLVLYDAGHFVFQVVPQLDIGFATGSNSATAVLGGTSQTQTRDNSGFLFGLGGTAGAEVHFGFMDLPNLSLQANVGLALRYESWSQDDNAGTEYSRGGFNFSTNVGTNPWEIFTSNVNAIYYF